MGRCFSDAVEQALQYIYYEERWGRGLEGFHLLEDASAKGDGDASCILARCLSGFQYVWSGHGFPTDTARAEELLSLSVVQGSAIGVLTALRHADGVFPPDLREKMPFVSLQEAFDIVKQNAVDGDTFCQYIIGNCYYWKDFLEIEQRTKKDFPNGKAFQSYIKENMMECEDWFWKAFRGGIYFAGNHLTQYYRKGNDHPPIPPNPEKGKDILRIGAEYGYPVYQYLYAESLKGTDVSASVKWYEQAAEGGEIDAWYYVGIAYDKGKGVEENSAYAARCYEKGLSSPQKSIPCHNRLGALYMEGRGVPQDYARAYRLFLWAYQEGSLWGVDALGRCCFYGLGAEQDFVQARYFLEQVPGKDKEVFYMLGCIYGQGLGVSPDIKKAVGYLQKAENYVKAKEELQKYKKTLFGKWVRRKEKDEEEIE